MPEYWYGVHRGRVTGVYETWDECKWAIGGYRYPRHRKFLTREDAQEYVATGIVPTHATYTEMVAGTKRPGERAPDTSSEPGDVKSEPIDLTLDVAPEDTDVVYVHGYGWSKDEGEGVATPIAGVAVWWGARDQRNIGERCPGNQSMHCASLVTILRALETAPRRTRPLQIVSSSKYATDCINSWLPRWMKNGFKSTRYNEPIKYEDLLRCIGAHLDERRHFGQAVRLLYISAASDDAASRSAKALAKRGAQGAVMPLRDYAQLEAASRARITGLPVPIAHPLETQTPTPRTPPRKKQRVDTPSIPPPPHAALMAAMYSPRKMAILAQAAAILAVPPAPPVFTAPPPPPVRASRPVVRSKVPLPGRAKALPVLPPKSLSAPSLKSLHAPPPPPIRPLMSTPTSSALNYERGPYDLDISPYTPLLAEHGVKAEPY
ncbi:hypothetical protein C8R43DRAFT_1244435 [Mycena crocata]|nr:hypothetical protein C8R43DRAFT_1244435 [Mycena crocata]